MEGWDRFPLGRACFGGSRENADGPSVERFVAELWCNPIFARRIPCYGLGSSAHFGRAPRRCVLLHYSSAGEGHQRDIGGSWPIFQSEQTSWAHQKRKHRFRVAVHPLLGALHCNIATLEAIQARQLALTAMAYLQATALICYEGFLTRLYSAIAARRAMRPLMKRCFQFWWSLLACSL